ncbi:hypothetical protein HUJ05_003111 [Dendroctonus ponderosae]|nr:hypothetical protein HUJ05_003111 [Dendroctonus ponderosae]
MTSLAAKNKKGTVIHRTTSETLRLGDEIINTQVRITTRKKSQATSPSCSFQITGVMTRYDQEDESADDLDESHTDEISRVTDNETPSFSEDSRDEQPLPQTPSVQIFSQNKTILARHTPPVEDPPLPPPPPAIKEEQTKPKANINDLGRFRVVKLGSMVPFSRGRWTCYDYVDESSEAKSPFPSVCHSASKKPFWESSCQPNYLYTGTLILPEPIPIYVPLTNEKPISSQYSLPKTSDGFPSCQSADTDINNSGLDTNQNNQSLTNNFNALVPLNKDVLLVKADKGDGLNFNGNTGIFPTGDGNIAFPRGLEIGLHFPLFRGTSRNGNLAQAMASSHQIPLDNAKPTIVQDTDPRRTGKVDLPLGIKDLDFNEATFFAVYCFIRNFVGASVSCTATIDTKIEHALDVVKNHLTHAVRVEVEELKVKINELVERISFLEYENDLLRSNVTDEVLANLGNIRGN